MKRCTWLFALLLTAGVWASGVPERSELEAFQLNLNSVERGFWNAVAVESGQEVHQRIRNRLSELVLLARKIQSRVRGGAELDLTVDVLDLQRVFNAVDPGALKGNKLHLKETSLAAYKQEYLRRARELEKGKKRSQIPPPSLFNVDEDHYASWVEGVADSNAEKVATSSGKLRMLHERVQKYSLAMCQLRIKLVKLARLIPDGTPETRNGEPK